jgi:hypothetical protein
MNPPRNLLVIVGNSLSAISACASLNDGELETSTTDYYSSAEQQFTFATDTRQADEFHNLQTASQATDLFQILLATEVI